MIYVVLPAQKRTVVVWWARLFIAVLGVLLVLGGPFITAMAVYSSIAELAAQVAPIRTMWLYSVAGLLSVILVTAAKDDHILSVTLSSMGIPGVVVALSISAQAIN